eukprot:365291_1
MSCTLKYFYQVILVLIPVLSVTFEHIDMGNQGSETWAVMEDEDIERNVVLRKIEEAIQYHTDRLNELQRQKHQILYGTVHNLIQLNISHKHAADRAISEASADWMTNQSITLKPTRSPTTSPTHNPTNNPTEQPTQPPTNHPTSKPTKNPTLKPTKKPTNAPTKKPTEAPIAWDKKPNAKKGARMSRKQKEKVMDDDHLLSAYNRKSQLVVRLYSVESPDITSTQQLELELLSNRFQPHDLVLFASNLDLASRTDDNHGVRYCSNYDSAFLFGQEFISYLYHYNRAKLITSQEDVVSFWVKYSHQALRQVPHSVGNAIFERLERHAIFERQMGVQQDDKFVQMVHFWRDMWHICNVNTTEATAVPRMPHKNYNVIVTVFFKYFYYYMEIMLKQKLLMMDQTNTSYFDYSELKKDIQQELPRFARTAASWFSDYGAKMPNASISVSRESFENVTSTMFALCKRITGLKAALDVTERIKEWMLNGTGTVAGVAVSDPSNEMLDILNDIGITDDRIQIWTARPKRYHVRRSSKSKCKFIYSQKEL